MKLENEFTVPADVSAAWDVLLDVERVAPCLPGAALEGGDGDEYQGTMTIKIGPITTRYTGTVKIEEADEAAHRAVMRAQARDSRGQGTAAATITSTMESVEGGTRVHVETDMRITGPAAQFGRGVMQDVSAKLMGRFADCLAAEIAAGGAAQTAAQTGGAAQTAAETAGAAQTGAETVGGPAAEEGGGAATPGSPQPAGETTASPPADARVAGPFNPAASPPPGPAGESAAAAARPAPASASGGAPRPVRPRPSEEVLDLGEASREAVLKRVVPVAAAMGVLILFLGIRRRLR